MIKYDDCTCTDTLVKFIGSVTVSTIESNVEWKCIRKDSPVYLSSAIAFGVDTCKKYYLTIQKDTPFFKLQLADNENDLKNNACMTSEKEVIMKVMSRDYDKENKLFMVMKNLFKVAEQQVEAAANVERNREEMSLEKLLNSY